MKHLFFNAIAVFLLFGATASYGQEKKAIDFSALPQTAQDFVNQYFSAKEVSTVFYDSDDREYEVRFSDGSKIEFDKKGSWEEIKDRDNVPAAVIPQPINDFLAAHHKNAKVLKISHDRKGYEVELLGDIELKFNKKGKFQRYDD